MELNCFGRGPAHDLQIAACTARSTINISLQTPAVKSVGGARHVLMIMWPRHVYVYIYIYILYIYIYVHTHACIHIHIHLRDGPLQKADVDTDQIVR